MHHRRWLAPWLFPLALALAFPAPAAAQADDEERDDADLTEKSARPGPEAKDTAADPGIQAPTIDGATGLIRTITADIGSRHTFRMGLHLEMFRSSGFLVPNDDNSRFLGTLTLSYTPWKYLELFAGLRSMANENSRPPEAGRLDQQVILSLGDFSFGGKLIFPLHKAFSLGGNINLAFLNSVGGVSVDGDSTSFYIGLVSSFYLNRISKAPLRFHFNLGFQVDNSNSLATFPIGGPNGYPVTSVQVEKFALGIKPSRLAIKIGIDAPLAKWTKWGVTPILEFAFDIATGDSDKDFDNDTFIKSSSNPGGSLTADDISGRLAAWATIGVRVRPVRGFNVELATDIGMVNPGFGFGPPVVPWNIILGFSYSYDPKPRIKIVTKERVRTVVKRVGKPIGKIRGRIINAKTLEPVEGATVTYPGRDLTGQSSDPDGGFLSYGFPAGKLPIMVRHPRYKPAKALGLIKVGGVTKLEVKLTPKPPKIGTLSGTVLDLKNNGVAATIAVSGPQTKQITANAMGGFNAKLKPGAYTLQVTATGYLRKEAKIKVTAGGTATVSFVISPKPRRSLVRITRRSLKIRRKVHFATNTADIKADSRQILDAIVDVLLRNPQIKHIEVQGHTDNRGSRARNMTLSQARADAVRDYLVRGGVSSDRLVARGYGPTRPKRPNITRRNRAKNRRVEFRIRK